MGQLRPDFEFPVPAETLGLLRLLAHNADSIITFKNSILLSS